MRLIFSSTARYLAQLVLLRVLLTLWTTIPQSQAANLTIPVDLAWGPYRPNQYLGIRPTEPDNLLFSLMWANATFDTEQLSARMRGSLDRTQGALAWTWQTYDSRTGGMQLYRDNANGLNISAQFVKFPNPSVGGGHWGVRVMGTPGRSRRFQKTVVIWHVAMESMQTGADGRELECAFHRRRLMCVGQHPTLGHFRVKTSPLDGSYIAEVPKVLSADVPDDHLWEAKASYIDHVRNAWHGRDASKMKEYGLNRPGKGNSHFLQYVFVGSFAFDFMYTSTSYQLALGTPNITQAIDKQLGVMDQNFNIVFPWAPPFTRESHGRFFRILLANLLGGLGFFDGRLQISTAVHPNEPAVVEKGPPTRLLTHTPSRKHMAEGVYWHEGFHLLVVQQWDLDLAIKVLWSWLLTMNSDGWIANHQVIGGEAASGLEHDEQVQQLGYTTPPSLLALALPPIVRKLMRQEDYVGRESQFLANGSSVLKDLYPLCKKHYMWFRNSQKGDMSRYTGVPSGIQGYAWRHCLDKACTASGLEDYPRPHFNQSPLHADALAWFAASAAAMADLANGLGMADDAQSFANDLASARKTLNFLHWDEQAGVWYDVVPDKLAPGFRHVHHVGYASLMPFLLGLLTNPTAGWDVALAERQSTAVLRVIMDRDELWSPYGLRSLSAKDPYYASGVDVWRGRVWVNFNVLAALRLRDAADRPLQTPAAASLAVNMEAPGAWDDDQSKRPILSDSFHIGDGHSKDVLPPSVTNNMIQQQPTSSSSDSLALPIVSEASGAQLSLLSSTSSVVAHVVDHCSKELPPRLLSNVADQQQQSFSAPSISLWPDMRTKDQCSLPSLSLPIAPDQQLTLPEASQPRRQSARMSMLDDSGSWVDKERKATYVDDVSIRRDLRQAAAELRENIVNTVHRFYPGRREQFWESYSDRNGAGGVLEGFTGWTSCLVLLVPLQVASKSSPSTTSSATPPPSVTAWWNGYGGVMDPLPQSGSPTMFPRTFGLPLSLSIMCLGVLAALMLSRHRIKAALRRALGWESPEPHSERTSDNISSSNAGTAAATRSEPLMSGANRLHTVTPSRTTLSSNPPQRQRGQSTEQEEESEIAVASGAAAAAVVDGTRLSERLFREDAFLPRGRRRRKKN